MALHALPEIYRAIRERARRIVFVNTRAQAELMFQALWRLNDDNLPIALHHGSLEIEQRRKVEAAMAAGKAARGGGDLLARPRHRLGRVDLVVQVGAPKGVGRLLQRIGRANHRLDEPSRARCWCRPTASRCWNAAPRSEAVRARAGRRPAAAGGLDVLAQHVMAMACAGAVPPDELYAEVTRAAPYAALTARDFDDVLRFVEDGGYALRRLRALPPPVPRFRRRCWRIAAAAPRAPATA
jgi:ATP-dependent helicase Lhr and Lhr-like helicase